MKIVVVGGAGAMGRITVRDLFETAPPDTRIVVADFNLDAAQELVGSLDRKRVSALRLDVRDAEGLKSALRGCFAVINAAHYQHNLAVMTAALAVGAHYTDLGGLFHMTRLQLELDAKFRKHGLTAILGMGAAPGITNVLARAGADRLDAVTEIHCRVGSADATRYSFEMALPVSYSIKTILEEFSMNPACFTEGRFTFVEPMSGAVPHRFPPPVGLRHPMHTLHSEVATLPLSFAEKGVREVSFKIAFDPLFLDRVRFLRDVGLAAKEPVLIQGQPVVPIDLVNAVVMSQPRPRQIGPLKQYEVVRTIVKGVRGRKKETHIVDCHTAGLPAWDIGLDLDTGSPPSIAVQMLARGEITARGTVPPEEAVPVEPFFRELKKRCMKVQHTVKPGWSFKS